MAIDHCRKNTTLPLPFAAELIVDNFAGGGGASSGIELGFARLGLKREVAIAINHDGEALAMHATNHPNAKHYREDVFEVHPGFVTGQQPIGLAWFSPDCKHHSRAKGGKPREQKIRGLAWITLKWAALQKPRGIILENVCEFEQWGPLLPNGKSDPSHRGRTFHAFVSALSSGIEAGHPDLAEIHETLGGDFPVHQLVSGLGYRVEWRSMKACDYGAPTTRTRLFLVARRDGLPIVWPTPTHAPRDSDAVKSGSLLPYRSAAECIDWSIPCPSIFERKKPLAEATMRRIARGLQKYVLHSGDPFIVKFRFESTGSSIHSPLPTITAGSHQSRPGGAAHALGLCTPTLIQIGYGERAGQSPRCLDIAEPLGTIVAGGGKHALVCAFLAQHNKARQGVNPGRAATDPLSTVTARGSQQSLVTAHLVDIENLSFDCSSRCDVGDPHQTTTENRQELVASCLVKFRGNNDGAPLTEPLPTISAQGMHHAEVRALLMQFGPPQKNSEHLSAENSATLFIDGVHYAIVDIGLRMLSPRELARCQGFAEDYVIDPVYNGKPLTKSSQVRMIGNSVSPHPAAALVAANFAHELVLYQSEAA